MDKGSRFIPHAGGSARGRGRGRPFLWVLGCHWKGCSNAGKRGADDEERGEVVERRESPLERDGDARGRVRKGSKTNHGKQVLG